MSAPRTAPGSARQPGAARRLPSLRLRLLLATLAGVLVALVLAGFTLARLFQEQVETQFRDTLVAQLDQLTARLEFDNGQPRIDSAALSDPRLELPYSGLYWQLDESNAAGAPSRDRTAILRSRSLWDTGLVLTADPPGDGKVHVHHMTGPQQASLLVVARTVSAPGQLQERWRLIVAGDLAQTHEAMARFRRALMLSLAALMALLMLAGWAQVHIGLLPLHALEQGLRALRSGGVSRLQGRFPTEVQPLVADFNEVLARNEEVVARSRMQAGNLAHALKTPLAVLEQAAASQAPGLPSLVREQAELARHHIDWHLARARAAGSRDVPGRHSDVATVLQALIRTMRKLHAARGLDIRLDVESGAPGFAGEEQDLQEILGNLLDNACKWARNRVTVGVLRHGDGRMRVTIEDDGPGIDPEQRQSVLERGVRLDERTPGSGLGLSIARELVQLYEGELTLTAGKGGGLCAMVTLPAQPSS